MMAVVTMGRVVDVPGGVMGPVMRMGRQCGPQDGPAVEELTGFQHLDMEPVAASGPRPATLGTPTHGST